MFKQGCNKLAFTAAAGAVASLRPDQRRPACAPSPCSRAAACPPRRAATKTPPVPALYRFMMSYALLNITTCFRLQACNAGTITPCYPYHPLSKPKERASAPCFASCCLLDSSSVHNTWDKGREGGRREGGWHIGILSCNFCVCGHKTSASHIALLANCTIWDQMGTWPAL